VKGLRHGPERNSSNVIAKHIGKGKGKHMGKVKHMAKSKGLPLNYSGEVQRTRTIRVEIECNCEL
jgi:hypothetical protein